MTMSYDLLSLQIQKRKTQPVAFRRINASKLKMSYSVVSICSESCLVSTTYLVLPVCDDCLIHAGSRAENSGAIYHTSFGHDHVL